jgi:hypothetical protein
MRLSRRALYDTLRRIRKTDDISMEGPQHLDMSLGKTPIVS